MEAAQWILLTLIGAVLGTFLSFLSSTMGEKVRMPPFLCILLGMLGAALGGALAKITQAQIFGAWTFYILGGLLAVGLLTGGLLDYYLTSTEERV